MEKIKFSYVAAKITGINVLFYCVFFIILYPIGVDINELFIDLTSNNNIYIFFTALLFIIFLQFYFSIKIILSKMLKNGSIFFIREGNSVEGNWIVFIALTWAVFWRTYIINVFTGWFYSVFQRIGLYAEDPSLQSSIMNILVVIKIYLAILWMLKHQMGSIDIKRLSDLPSSFIDKNLSIVSGEVRVVHKTDYRFIEMVGTVLIRVAMISYFAIGLVQYAAVIGFFTDYLGWWSIPSYIAALFVAGIPVFSAIAGTICAIEFWQWQWYWAISLFFFPVILYFIGMSIGWIISSIKK